MSDKQPSKEAQQWVLWLYELQRGIQPQEVGWEPHAIAINLDAFAAERVALQKRVAELQYTVDVIADDEYQLRLACIADADRYLAALKAEACRVEKDHVNDYGDPTNGKVAWKIGGIGFTVARNADGSLEAEEVVE